MTRFYISDTHFSHLNIIKYCNRPFKHTDEMDEALVKNWNDVVKPEDHITHLGDVTIKRGGVDQQEWFIRLIHRLNGHKRLHLGNHDHWPVEVYLRAGFEKIYATWRTEENILFSHIPIHPLSMGSAIANVHGHTHDQPNYSPHIDERKIKRPFVNICVEHTNFKPISLEEVQVRIKEAGSNA